MAKVPNKDETMAKNVKAPKKVANKSDKKLGSGEGDHKLPGKGPTIPRLSKSDKQELAAGNKSAFVALPRALKSKRGSIHTAMIKLISGLRHKGPLSVISNANEAAYSSPFTRCVQKMPSRRLVAD